MKDLNKPMLTMVAVLSILTGLAEVQVAWDAANPNSAAYSPAYSTGGTVDILPGATLSVSNSSPV